MKREEGRVRSIDPPPNPQFWGDRAANHQDSQMETQAIEHKINLQRVELILPCGNNLLQ
jgi:hypothetical protein